MPCTMKLHITLLVTQSSYRRFSSFCRWLSCQAPRLGRRNFCIVSLRYGAGAVHTYVLGGYNQMGSALRNVECLFGFEWKEVARMLRPTGDCRATGHGGSIVVVSGCETVSHMEIFRRICPLGTGQWTLLEVVDRSEQHSRMASLVPSSEGFVALSTSDFPLTHYP